MQQINKYYSNIVIGIPDNMSFSNIDWSLAEHYAKSGFIFSILSDDSIDIINEHVHKTSIAPITPLSQSWCLDFRKNIDTLFGDMDHFRRQYIVCGPGLFTDAMWIFTELREYDDSIGPEQIANVATNEDILYISLGST